MKVAIASDDGRTIAPHLGRTRGFLIFDLAAEGEPQAEYRPNSFTAHARGECGTGHAHGASQHHHGPILAALSDCQALVACGMGRRIQEDLKQAGIDVFLTTARDAAEALRLFREGKLDHNPDAACQHHHHHHHHHHLHQRG